MKYLKKHLSSIIISLVIGVFIFYIQPILSYIGNKVVDFLIFTSDSFSESYYGSIAFNNPFLFDDFNSYILTIGTVLFFLELLKNFLERRNKLITKATSNLDRIRSLKEKIKEEKKEIDKSIVQQELEELETSTENLSLVLEKKSNKFLTLTILISFMVILLFSNYALNKSITKENVSFRNKMIVLLPIIGEKNVNLLKAEWTQMNNSNDYKSIMTKIEKYEQSKVD
ncbi:hypothetical protein [Flammeovirga sp. EKP202]|uniref:hypothetical protein n=1 Tax=Flammeovirga sp. EKP202 TaxID=2770592 RepID=UPI00165F52ED|nr:hypothetical protein [Flammeovirga sp. EKP202]MBD0403650.1 hypothetical protein [Flammeovirga sp. EKP202]